MKLYRLAHTEIAFQLEDNPISGFNFIGKQPFFCAFESIAAAILECGVYRTLKRMPQNFCFVEFRLPEHCWISTIQGESIIDQVEGTFTGYPGTKARQFLQERKALVASFPSLHWRAQLNFLINPRHPLFKEITITKILPCI